MNQGRRKKSLSWRDEEASDAPEPALETPAREAHEKKRGIGVAGVRRRAVGVAPTRPPHAGGRGTTMRAASAAPLPLRTR